MKKSAKLINTMTWQWIKEAARENVDAQVLVKLALKVRCEPNKLAGVKKINEWLEEIEEDTKFGRILENLETQFHNHFYFARQSTLNDAG